MVAGFLYQRVRLVRRADGYYCQFCIDVEVSDIQPMTGNEIGLDVGIESFYADSNGYQESNPRFLRKLEKSIKHAQRRIYNKKKGSLGRKKARAIFARKHLRISRQWIEYFAGLFGKLAVAISPHYTSQKCSSCGVTVKKSLSTRTHICSCGCNLHRDENAAINILSLARQARVGHTQSNAVGLVTATLLGESLLEQVTR
ncbi:transposase [Calothrix brevissima NIES-22]|nr:transposase [Calothrix brevissima NIES-22]